MISQPVDDRLRRAWRRGLVALAGHVASSESWAGPQLGPSERGAGPAPNAHERGGSPREGEPGAATASKRAREGASVCLPNRRHLGLARKTGPRNANTALSRRVIALRLCCGLVREVAARERGQPPHPAPPLSGRSPPNQQPASECLDPNPSPPGSAAAAIACSCQHVGVTRSVMARPCAQTDRRKLELCREATGLHDVPQRAVV